MLDVKINRNGPAEDMHMTAEGSLEELLNDVGTVVREIYNHIREDQGAADAFKCALQFMVEDDGPVWKTREELKEGGGCVC